MLQNVGLIIWFFANQPSTSGIELLIKKIKN